MADNRTIQLLAASFRGVSFSVTSESIPKAGRKIIVHELVNSDDQTVEDQGKIPANFTIRAFIHGPNFIQDANNFQEALNQKGSGALVLPTLGSLNVFAGTYKVNASQKTVGEISFDIPFFAGRPKAGPIEEEKKSKEDTFQNGDTSRKNIGETIGGPSATNPTKKSSSFITKINSVANSIVAATDLDTILTEIGGAVSTVLPVEDAGTLLNTIEIAKLNITNLINNPTLIGEVLFSGTPFVESIWQQVSVSITKTLLGSAGPSQSAEITDTLIGLTNIGSGLSLSVPEIQGSFLQESVSQDIATWPETTAERIDRNTTRQNIVQANRIAALVVLYEVIATREYDSDGEISTIRSAAEDIHEKIMRVESSDRELIQANLSVRKSVEDTRISSLNVLEQKEQESFIIQDLELKAPTSSFVLSYLLYAEEFTDSAALSERAQVITSLNTSQSSDRMIGDVKILQVKNV